MVPLCCWQCQGNVHPPHLLLLKDSLLPSFERRSKSQAVSFLYSFVPQFIHSFIFCGRLCTNVYLASAICQEVLVLELQQRTDAGLGELYWGWSECLRNSHIWKALVSELSCFSVSLGSHLDRLHSVDLPETGRFCIGKITTASTYFDFDFVFIWTVWGGEI